VAKDGFRRGFKAEAERIALELRAEIGLGPSVRLEPASLAEHLLIPVLTLFDLQAAAPADVAHFLGEGRSEFSAATIYAGRYRRAIVTNPAHASTRQMSSLCHELSHVALGHEGETPLTTAGGRTWNGMQEHEADWLAGCFLVPGAGAHRAARDGLSDDDVALLFGVSVALAAWRMNATGARLRVRRLARFRVT
jgi:hypothetical protein